MNPTSSQPSLLRVGLALSAVYVIWGSTYLAIAIAIETLPPFWMAGVRFVVAGALLYGWSLWRVPSSTSSPSERWSASPPTSGSCGWRARCWSRPTPT